LLSGYRPIHTCVKTSVCCALLLPCPEPFGAYVDGNPHRHKDRSAHRRKEYAWSGFDSLAGVGFSRVCTPLNPPRRSEASELCSVGDPKGDFSVGALMIIFKVSS